MNTLIHYLALPLGILMKGCYQLVENYGIAIIFFTLLSKIILLPLSIWLQKNSIIMVKIQPAINIIKVNYFGDQDRIAEEQSKLFKKEKYNPLASVIPLLVQIILLMGVIEVISHPFTYILGIPESVITAINALTAQLTGADVAASSIQLAAAETIKSGAFASVFAQLPEAVPYLGVISAFNMNFMGLNIGWIPNVVHSAAIVIPLIAGVSAWWMCYEQNKRNVLQMEQSNWNKYGMMALSIALALYLGWFVPVGVGLYWICGNLMAVIQLWLLNIAIPPKKYVDYAALEESKKKLEELENLEEKKPFYKKDENTKRERTDYKKFFSVANKHLVFYAASSGFFKYFSGIIQYLLQRTNLVIHYVTSDPQDQIFTFAKEHPQIKPYYIGPKKLITLMMKMDADIVVMTMPDLNTFHIKRSYVRKDIEYIYVPHGMDSLNLTMRKGSVDHFDTVFCVGPHQREEIQRTQAVYNLPSKTLVDWGYSLLDEMKAEYAEQPKEHSKTPEILIAPSWQDDNIVDSCLDELLEALTGISCHITVRPHPQHVKHRNTQLLALKEKYDSDNIEIQMDFSSNKTVFDADLLLTDWSGIAYEFAFTTNKPVLFINTPMKIMNPEYERIGVVPLNISIREKIGSSLEVNEIKQKAQSVAQDLLDHSAEYHDRIAAFTEQYVYHPGTSSEVGAKYIIAQLQKRQEK